MKNYQKILISCLIIVSFFWITNVWAQGWVPLVPCGGEGQPKCGLCHLWQLGSNIFNFLLWDLSIPIATILFVVAGFIILISGGNQERVSLGKRIFVNTVIGLLIVFCSWLLIDTLFKTLATGEFSGAWNRFPACPSPPT